MTDDGKQAYPVTYYEAELPGTARAREHFDELSGRAFSARTVATLRDKGEFDPANHGHALLAANEPLSAREHLEMITAGTVLAKYYQHPSQVHHAVRAGATFEQIAAALDVPVDKAVDDYADWAERQHRYGYLPDQEYGAAVAALGDQEAGE